MPIWMTIAEWASRIILLLLVFLSIWSVSIMLDRKKLFKAIEESPWLKNGDKKNVHDFWLRAVRALSVSKSTQNIERDYESFLEEEKPYLEKGIPVLGTLGSTAPFIGLLGTVLGIIKAFGELSINAMNTNKIMFLLAEALILTAVGLAVAIPSVVAFNYFQRKIRRQVSVVKTIKNDIQNAGA